MTGNKIDESTRHYILGKMNSGGIMGTFSEGTCEITDNTCSSPNCKMCLVPSRYTKRNDH